MASRSALANAEPRPGEWQPVIQIDGGERVEIWCQAPASWIGSTLELWAVVRGFRRRVAQGVLRSSSEARRVLSYEGPGDTLELQITSAAGAAGTCALLAVSGAGTHDEGSRAAPGGVPIVPADAGEHWFSSLYIGGAGAVTVDHQGRGTNVTYSGLAAGSVLPVAVSRVYATGTDATLIIGQDE